MNLITYLVLTFALIGSIACGKLKLVGFKGPHFGFVGVKVRTPKLLGLKHALGGGLGGHGGFGGGFGGHGGFGSHGHGGFGGGGYHSSGYEHHEYHESHHSSGGGGGFGGGLWGK